MKNRNFKYLGFNDHWLYFIGVPTVGFLMPVLFFGKTFDNGFIAYLPSWGVSIMYSLYYWTSTRFILLQSRKKYPDFKDSHKRIMQQVILSVVSAFIFSRIVDYAAVEWFHQEEDEYIISGDAAVYGIIFLMIAVYESIYFYYHLKLTIEEKEEVRRAQLHSELEGLRNQVNPHFLFNSLNTLMNIVAEDQKLAISFLKKLSKVYRYVLDSRRKQLITLATEMEFMESYIFLQKERFHHSLQVKIDIPEQYFSKQILPLALQILFENAIKHNIVSSKRPLTISVFIKNEKLFVQNNLQRKNMVMPGTKVGLENVKTRYKIFTEQAVEVLINEHYFTVTLPLIERLP